MHVIDPASFYDSLDSYTHARAPYHPGLIDYVLKQAKLDEESLRKHGKTPQDVTIADIASGTGQLSIPLAKRGYRMICADPSSQMNDTLLKNAEAEGVRDNIIVREVKAHDTGIGEHEVDLITTGTAAHWLAASDEAKHIPVHWKKILKEGGKAAVLYSIPSLEDPVVRAVHDALTASDALEKYPHLAKGYQEAAFFVFSDWDKVDRYAGVLLDQNASGLAYGVEETMHVTRQGDTHPLDAVRAFLQTVTPTKKPIEEHPEEWQRLVEHVKKSVPEAEQKPLQWACRVYMGEPRMRALSMAERVGPTAATRGHGMFG